MYKGFQAIRLGRNGDEMNMVTHQTISQHSNLMLLAIVFEPRKILIAVIICEKHIFTTITTLRNVVR